MTAQFRRLWNLLLLVSMLLTASVTAQVPETGPRTEERFPPLQVPEGLQVTLFACDPFIEYPSVIALGPETGSLFVAHDYMTGLGVEIIRRDEIRLIRDTDGDGYADQSTLFADGFNSIQGLAWHAGTMFVMHAPFLTSLTDTDGDGQPDERRDLFDGLGLPPEENSNRLHCANGVVVGHDGWLYLALGDRGCDVQRPEGDRLVFREGGILRCRPDGRDLHVFSHGLRNIYDIALDEELNVFVRDNENDGGDYMIRVCHCFHGSDHGYPYLYYERSDEAMPPLADLGRGSSAGGTAYLETAFPAEYRDSLFFCEWGRAVVRYPKQRAGSSFVPMEEIDFATGAADDPYGFKPTDLVVDYDGSLLISDWCDGQRPKRGRGRIYRVTSTEVDQQVEDPAGIVKDAGLEELLKHLNSSRYCLRWAAQDAIEAQGPAGLEAVRNAIQDEQLTPIGRLHAVWILAHLAAENAVEELFELAESDPDPRVQAQCVRALADLTDPVLRTHHLDAGRGETQICERFARLGEDADPQVLLEVLIALGRLHWSDAPEWLSWNWNESDPALEHAAMVLLRRCDNWSAVLKLLDSHVRSSKVNPFVRTLALRALAERPLEVIVDGLLERLEREQTPQRRREYLDLLARVHRKPAAWTYWGFRPDPRPADSVDWDRTEVISAALENALRDPDSTVRSFSVRRMLREEVPIPLKSLNAWLKRETEADAVAAILEALAGRPAEDTRDLLEPIVWSETYSDDNRLSAFQQFVSGLESSHESRLLKLANSLEEGVVLVAVLKELGGRPGLDSPSVFLTNLASANDDVRAAAIEALVKHPVEDVAARVPNLLEDRDLRVRRAAALLAGQLKVREATEQLLAAAGHADKPLRAAGLKSLAELKESAAVPLALEACDDPETQLSALECLAAVGSPEHLPAVLQVAERSRSMEILSASVRALIRWQQELPSQSFEWRQIEHAVATIQSASGMLLVWRVRQVNSDDASEDLVSRFGKANQPGQGFESGWRRELAAGTAAHVTLPGNEGDTLSYLASTDVIINDRLQLVEFLLSADGVFRVWMNGQQIYQRQKAAAFQTDSDRFEAALRPGVNRISIAVTGERPAPRFQVRFRRKSSKAEHEKLTQLALRSNGNVLRGRELFLDKAKSQCLNCHRIGEQGGKIGPDLAGIGSRFSRIHLVESILEPSRTVAPSYETLVVVLEDGRVITGVKVAETKTLLTLGDNEGKTHDIAKSEIEEFSKQSKSTMPDGLEKRLTQQEFVNLISFLLSQKKTTSK